MRHFREFLVWVVRSQMAGRTEDEHVTVCSSPKRYASIGPDAGDREPILIYALKRNYRSEREAVF